MRKVIAAAFLMLFATGLRAQVNVNTVAIQPAMPDAIQFVSINGNNSNSGLSWSSAKADWSAAYSALPTARDGSKYGTIRMGGGLWTTSTQLILGTSGHNDAINVIGSCGGGNVVSGSVVGTSTVFNYTGSGAFIEQIVSASGNQNDRAGLIDCIVIDGNGNPNSGAGGIEFGGTEGQRIGAGVYVQNFSGAHQFGIEVFNNTGINTNNWKLEAKFWNDTNDLIVSGPNCSSGTPSSSNAQHHYINSQFSLFTGQVGILAECGVALGRGTIIATGAMQATSDSLMQTDLHSNIGPDFVADSVENDSGGDITRYNAAAMSQSASAGTISLDGYFESRCSSTDPCTGGDVLTGYDPALPSLSYAGIYNTVTNNIVASGAAPTISSGFGTSASIIQQNGTQAFEINVGTGGTATSGVIGLPAAVNGWSCQVSDMSTNIVTRETAFTVSSVTLTAASAWTASDKLLINCGAF